MVFKTEPEKELDGYEIPTSWERNERIQLEPGHRVIGKAKELRYVKAETQLGESEFVVLTLENPETGELGDLTGWLSSPFGKQMKSFFGTKNEDGEIVLKPELVDALVAITKVETISESSGMAYYQMGVKVLEQPNKPSE